MRKNAMKKTKQPQVWNQASFVQRTRRNPVRKPIAPIVSLTADDLNRQGITVGWDNEDHECCVDGACGACGHHVCSCEPRLLPWEDGEPAKLPEPPKPPKPRRCLGIDVTAAKPIWPQRIREDTMRFVSLANAPLSVTDWPDLKDL
jgi:hypothetical protein